MAHKSMLKGGAFRLNLHPVECFDRNPYKFDKPLPPPKKTEEKKHITLPFKPSSPNKKVRKGDQMQCKNVHEELPSWNILWWIILVTCLFSADGRYESRNVWFLPHLLYRTLWYQKDQILNDE